ncbi:MAG: hypothetical protein J5637_08310 [Prevotella sp.]|nr:hypothetical protein [Prevotella sp.]
MKKTAIILTLALASIAAKTMGQAQVPKGKLVYVEYTDTLRTGRVFEHYQARQLKEGRVEVSAYDLYQDFDSLTVIGDRQPLDSIQRVIARWIEWFNPKGRRANDDRNKGRFLAIYDSGDTLLVDRFTWCYGMKDIQDYMMDYCTYQKTLMPFVELKGAIPEDVKWHNGMEIFYEVPRKGIAPRRYKGAGKEFLVFKNAKGAVTDIWVKLKKYGQDQEDGWMAILSGVYENETGMAVFGKVNAAERRYEGQPGSDIRFQTKVTYDGLIFTDTIYWGANRIQEVNPPPGAPPGWGGAGALTGPTTWVVKFTGNGLHVKELGTGVNAPTHPAFGKDFTLKKIRGPYRYCADPWAVTTEQPVTRGQLELLTITQLREMLAEFDKRHADGSRLTDMERLNKSFLQTYIRGRQGK